MWHLKPLEESAQSLKVCMLIFLASVRVVKYLAHLILMPPELDLQSCSHLKKSALSHIAKLACLQRLNLYKSTNLTSDIIAHIGRYAFFCLNHNNFMFYSNCKAIKHLNIGASCRLLDSKGIAVLNTALSRLK